jgi:hypothetical protein
LPLTAAHHATSVNVDQISSRLGRRLLTAQKGPVYRSAASKWIKPCTPCPPRKQQDATANRGVLPLQNTLFRQLLLLGFLLLRPGCAPSCPAPASSFDDSPTALWADTALARRCCSRLSRGCRSCRSQRHSPHPASPTRRATPPSIRTLSRRCRRFGSNRRRSPTQDRVQLFLKSFDLFFDRNRTAQLLTGQTGKSRIHETSQHPPVTIWQAGNDSFCPPDGFQSQENRNAQADPA